MLNKRHILSLFSAIIQCIFVLSTEIKRERPKQPDKMSTKKFHHAVSSQLATLLLMLLSVVGVYAQGWELSYGGSKEDRATALVQTKDGGFLSVGYSESFGSDNDIDVYVVRTDQDGKVLWSQIYDEGFIEQAFDVIEVENGDFLIVGFIRNNVGEQENVYLLRIDASGKMVWSKQYGKTNTYEQGRSLVKAIDGGYVIVGSTKDTPSGEDDILLIKVDAQGNQLWSKNYGGDKDDDGRAITVFRNGYVFVGSSDNILPNTFDNDIVVYRIDAQGNMFWGEPVRISSTEREEANDVIVSKDGNIVLAGVINGEGDAYIVKLDSNGAIIWKRPIIRPFGQEANAIAEVSDGDLVVTGITETSSQNIDILFARLNSLGNELIVSGLGEKSRTDWGEDIVSTTDGGFAIAGYTSLALSFIDDVYILKTDLQGNTKTNYISGQVFFDRDGACDYDSGDPLLKEWLVKVTGGNKTYYGATDENGRYRILVDTGRYNVTVLPASQYWESCIAGGYNINLTNFYDTTSLNFPMTVAQACPYLEVDISTPFLAVCSGVEYTVSYCNLGTATAQDAYVEVTLDDKLTYVSSGVPFSSQNGKTYTFQLGNISATTCGSFKIQTQMACEGIAMGQSALVKVHIYPDTLCLEPGPEWDGSSLLVSGECKQDSVQFRIKNVGNGNMSRVQRYYVVQQDVVFINKPFQLGSGQELKENVVKDGSTYRLIAEQTKDHPGRSYPTVAIEGCASDGQDITTGYVTQFPEDDQDNFIDTDVQEIIGSITAAQMRGYPKGYRDSIIAANTEITYNILFKNAGIDTVRRVVIRDTLSPYLDFSTLRLETSSHPYKFDFTGTGILKITFDNIELLPDGSANGTSNWGYITFKISQKPNNTTNTLITNRAAIFFNYAAPVMTNEIRHVIGQFPDFITVDVDQPVVPGLKIKVSPNPFEEVAKIEVEGHTFNELTLRIFDSVGRQVSVQKFSGNHIMYYRNQMIAGLYFFRLESEGQLLGSGKLLVR